MNEKLVKEKVKISSVKKCVLKFSLHVLGSDCDVETVLAPNLI
jgi:hypothetical protein